jgi:hypothetical protein
MGEDFRNRVVDFFNGLPPGVRKTEHAQAFKIQLREHIRTFEDDIANPGYDVVSPTKDDSDAEMEEVSEGDA